MDQLLLADYGIIFANKVSGKAPTPEMLKQEKKIKAQEKK